MTPAPREEEAGFAGFFGHVRNYLVGGVLGGVITFGSVATLTRLLSPAEYGVLKVWLAVVLVAGVVVELNFRGAISRYYLEETEDMADFLKTVLRFLAVLGALVLVAAFLLREPLGAVLELNGWLAFLAIVAAVATVPWNLNWKLMAAKLESGAFSTLKVVRDAVVAGVVIAVVVLLPKTSDAEAVDVRGFAAVAGTVAVHVLFAIILAIKLGRQAAPGRVERRHLTYALAFGVPLIPHALSGHILSAFDRVIINQLENESAAGLYSFAYDVGAAMSMVVQAMNTAWQPLFTRARNREQHERIDAMAGTYAQYVAAIAIIIVLFSREVAGVLGDARYEEAIAIIPVVVLSYMAVFLYTIYANHSFYKHRTAYISVASLIAGVTNIGLNYWLIPPYGFAIAAWTTLASYLLLFLLHYATARFLLGERVPRLSRLLLWYGVAALVSYVFVRAEGWIDDYFMTWVALKLPIFLAVLVWIRHTKRRMDAQRALP